jgi:hypothetical protein
VFVYFCGCNHYDSHAVIVKKKDDDRQKKTRIRESDVQKRKWDSLILLMFVSLFYELQ